MRDEAGFSRFQQYEKKHSLILEQICSTNIHGSAGLVVHIIGTETFFNRKKEWVTK